MTILPSRVSNLNGDTLRLCLVSCSTSNLHPLHWNLLLGLAFMNLLLWWLHSHYYLTFSKKELFLIICMNAGFKNFIQWVIIHYYDYSFWSYFVLSLGVPDSSIGKESTCSAGDPGSIPGSGRSVGEGIGYPLQYSWASLVVQLVKNLPAKWEAWVWSLGWEDPLEKGKATHSNILARRIPWTV